MNDEIINKVISEWNTLKQFIKENEFNDIEYRKQFDNVIYETLYHFSHLCRLRAFKDEYDDITYVEQVKNIIETIDKKETISYKQFRVLCFFWKRVQYRDNNPIRKHGDVSSKIQKQLLHKNYINNM